MTTKPLILELYDIEAIKFGSFTLKSGMISPIYIDLRRIISYPKLLKQLSALLWEKAYNLSFELLCGVPYTALPIATCLSLAHNIPMVMKRKEAKDYGTKKMVEGVFHKGQKCLIIEDVVTSGSSIIETTEALEKEGLVVENALVLIDRGQGGKKRLEERGIFLYPLFTLQQLLDTLLEAQKITPSLHAEVKDFLHASILS